MAYWIIIGIAFMAVSYCFAYRVRKKYKIRDKGSEVFGLTLAMLWFSFLLGLYLSNCLQV